MAQSATMAGRFHDVVVGASKVIHDAEPDARDSAALHWALDMLKRAASTEIAGMPSPQQLAAAGTTVSALRRAARSSDAATDVALRHIRDGLEGAIDGRRDPATISSMNALQALFAGVSRLALRAEVQTHGERQGDHTWPLSTETSPS